MRCFPAHRAPVLEKLVIIIIFPTTVILYAGKVIIMVYAAYSCSRSPRGRASTWWLVHERRCTVCTVWSCFQFTHTLMGAPAEGEHTTPRIHPALIFGCPVNPVPSPPDFALPKHRKVGTRRAPEELWSCLVAHSGPTACAPHSGAPRPVETRSA